MPQGHRQCAQKGFRNLKNLSNLCKTYQKHFSVKIGIGGSLIEPSQHWFVPVLGGCLILNNRRGFRYLKKYKNERVVGSNYFKDLNNRWISWKNQWPSEWLFNFFKKTLRFMGIYKNHVSWFDWEPGLWTLKTPLIPRGGLVQFLKQPNILVYTFLIPSKIKMGHNTRTRRVCSKLDTHPTML